ncbi:MAG: PEP-CTERM sorting domain-containing protein [Planctomycetaceae bacterium]|nr:PEP-CTERM sorting domain-containing protein [Planctomycetaceae bacterium]
MKLTKKLFILLAISALSLGGNTVLADFDAEQYARTFGSYNLFLRTSTSNNGDPSTNLVQVVSPTGWRTLIGGQDTLDTYNTEKRTVGLLDPMRAPYGYDIGMYGNISGEGCYFFADDYYFSSFVLNSSPHHQEMRGTLNYSDGLTKTSDGKALNVGIAYLYMKYATGTLGGYDYASDSNAHALNDAFQMLLNNDLSGGYENEFLRDMILNASDPSTWLTPYNVNDVYPYIGDYAVYVMNLYEFIVLPEYEYYGYVPTGGDILYLARRIDNVGGAETPEPATLLFWSLGGLTLCGVAWRRKRNCKGGVKTPLQH